MEKFSDYRIISEQTPEQLSGKIKAYMALGWQPMGGVAIYPKPVSAHQKPVFVYNQAMVKDIDTEL